MFPRTHRVALDWLFDRINLDPKIQIAYIDTRDEWTIFCVCLTLAISVPPIVLKWCRKECKKIQVKRESQQNRSRWWISSRDAAKGLLTCLPLLHQKAQWKPDMKVKLLWVRKLRSTIELGDPLYAHTHQATQNGMLIKLGLLKSGNQMNWWKYEQGDLFINNHPVCSHSTQTDLLLMTMIWTLTPSQNQTCRWNPDHSCIGWMIKCERGKDNPQKMQQKTATNIL